MPCEIGERPNRENSIREVSFMKLNVFSRPQREPAQVFVLLQTIYQAFDVLAKKHKVFKVETIGDSYGNGIDALM